MLTPSYRTFMNIRHNFDIIDRLMWQNEETYKIINFV